MSTEETFGGLKAFFRALFIFVVLVLVASYVLTMLMGFGLFFFTPDGLSFSMRLVSPPVWLFLWFGFDAPAMPIGALFLLIWGVYVVCFIMAWMWRKSFHVTFRKVFSRSMLSVFNNFLFVMPLISSMSLTAALAIIYSQEAFGVPTGQPSLPPNPYEAFLSLAYAPVVEELGFRLVPIGFFMAVYIFLAGKSLSSLGGGNSLKLFLKALVYPEGAKKMAGLKTVSEHGIRKGVSRIEWVMVIVTSSAFGLAHILSGIGWEIGKVTSVFVQGFFFALTYIAYGFEAPILLHWFFNYYFFFFDPEIASKFFPTTVEMFSTIEMAISVLGVLGWIMFAAVGFHRLLRPKTEERAQVMETAPFITPQ